MAMKVSDRFDIEDEGTRFISLQEISRRYKASKRRFYSMKKLYQICRDHCKYGGKWPTMTRNAKIRAQKAAIACRHLQQLKQHLEAKTTAIKLN